MTTHDKFIEKDYKIAVKTYQTDDGVPADLRTFINKFFSEKLNTLGLVGNDFRKTFDVVDGKIKANNIMPILGLSDQFNIPDKENTFEEFANKAGRESEFLKKYLRSVDEIMVNPRTEIAIPKPDIFDAYRIRLVKTANYYDELRIDNDIRVDNDEYDAYIRLLHKYLIRINNNDSQSEEIDQAIQRSWPFEDLSFTEFINNFDLNTVPIGERRLSKIYTLEFIVSPYNDSFTLDRFYDEFAEQYNVPLEFRALFADQIAMGNNEFEINYEEIIRCNQKILKYFDRTTPITKTINHSFKFTLNNFRSGTRFSPTMSIKNNTTNEFKIITPKRVIKYSIIKKLLPELTDKQIYDIIHKITISSIRKDGNTPDSINITIDNVNYLFNNIFIGQGKSSVLYNGKTISNNTTVTLQTIPTEIFAYRFCWVDKQEINLSASHLIDLTNAYESSGGLYPSQINFSENALNPNDRVIIDSSPVGGGKTTNVTAFAHTVKKAKHGQNLVIYTTGASENVLRDVCASAKETGLNVATLFTVKNKGEYKLKIASITNKHSEIIVNEMFKETNDRNRDFVDFLRYDILICSIGNLVKFLGLAHNKKLFNGERYYSICDDFYFVLDETISGGINSTLEHRTGAFLAYNVKKLSILSASIKPTGAINYLQRLGRKLYFVPFGEAFVPTEFRQIDDSIIDPFNWSNNYDTSILKSDTFLLRSLTLKSLRSLNDSAYINQMLENNIFDPARIFTFAKFNKYQQPSIRINATLAEEIIKINELNYYTLVSTMDPVTMATAIYGPVFVDISSNRDFKEKCSTITRLRNELFHNKTKSSNDIPEYEQILAEINAMEKVSVNYNGKFIDINPPNIIDYYVGGIDMDIRQLKPFSSDTIVTDQLDVLRLEGVTETRLRNLVKFIPQARDIIERMIDNYRSNGLIEYEQQKIDRLERIRSIKEGRVDIADSIEQHIAETREFIRHTLAAYGIIHKYEMSEIDYKEIAHANFAQILDLLGVYVEDLGTVTLSSNKKINRIFADEKFSRGSNFPIECVYITKDFGDAVSADTILQTTGRCGRPGKSMISIVYMTYQHYDKIYNQQSTNDVNNIMQRTQFYRQPIDETSLLKNIDISEKEQNRRILNFALDVHVDIDTSLSGFKLLNNLKEKLNDVNLTDDQNRVYRKILTKEQRINVLMSYLQESTTTTY